MLGYRRRGANPGECSAFEAGGWLFLRSNKQQTIDDRAEAIE
jgi:hypothetical protein